MSRLHSINHDQKLYVFKEGGGYSCLGFDVCKQRAIAYLQWLQGDREKRFNKTNEALIRAVSGHKLDCKALLRELEDCSLERRLEIYEAAQAVIHANYVAHHERCPVELSPQLIGLEGKLVEAVTTWDETVRFRVGKSTGWIPIHLEIEEGEDGGVAASKEYKLVNVIGETSK